LKGKRGMRKRDILLCDANFCVLPIVEAIKKRGYRLSVAGSLLKDPAHALADRSVDLDYSDVESLYQHIQESAYDGIVPGCNDRSYLSLAYVAEKLGYPGFDSFDTVLTIHHKDKFRLFAQKQGYPIPRAITSLDEAAQIRFPVLVKPVDSFSGKGISKAKDLEALHQAWKEAEAYSPSGAVVAEEFIEGKLYSHSAFIKDKKIVVDFFVNEYCTVYPYQVNSSNLSTELDPVIMKGLREWTETFARDLDLCDGLVHTQFISDNKTFSLIEIARRCPGDLYSQLIQKSTGVDYAALYAMPFCRLELPEKIEPVEQNYMARHTVSTDQPCIYIASSLDIPGANIENVQLKYSGEKMKAAPHDKSGIYFIRFDSAQSMEAYTEVLKDHVKIETLDIEIKER